MALSQPDWFNLVVTVAMLSLSIATIAKVTQIDKSDSEKRIGVIAGLAFAAGIIGAFLATKYFADYPEYGTQFVTAIVFLFFLPATLMAVSTLTIVLSNAPAPL